MIINKKLTIDLFHPQPFDNFQIHVDDLNSVNLKLQILKDGVPVSLTSSMSVKYDAVIAGYLAEEDADGSIDNNMATIPITSNMVALPGLLEIDVKFIEDTSKLFTQTINMTVNRSVINGSTIIDLHGTTIGRRLDEIDEEIARLDSTKLDDSAGSVKSSNIASGAVITSKIADNAVSTPKIANSAVTAPKIAMGTITTEKLNPTYIDDTPTIHTGATKYLVTSDGVKNALNDVDDELSRLDTIKLDDSSGSVKSSNLASNAVTVSKIADGAITTAKLNSSYIDSSPTIHSGTTKYLVTSDGVKSALNTVDTSIGDLNSRMSTKMSLIPDEQTTAGQPVGQILASPGRGKFFTLKWIGGTIADGGLMEFPTLSAEQACPDDNYAWYSDHSWNCKLRGSYYLMGNLCILVGRASLIENWGVVYYSLPRAAVNTSSTLAVVNDKNFTINTDTLSNTSVMRIAKFDGGGMPSGEVYFTLIYRYY